MNPQPKSNKYHNRRLTQSAQHEACVSCGANDSTIVWAHSNQYRHGKGKSTKAHDLFGAYLCYGCHSDYDLNRLHLALRDDEEDWFGRMWERSMIIACEKGYL